MVEAMFSSCEPKAFPLRTGRSGSTLTARRADTPDSGSDFTETVVSDEADLRCWREKCLALPPDVAVETLRDRAIVVAAADAAGRRFEATLRGGAARQFLHELDHARGTLIVDHALDLVGSALYPGMAALEAPDHDERRRRAWARGDVG